MTKFYGRAKAIVDKLPCTLQYFFKVQDSNQVLSYVFWGEYITGNSQHFHKPLTESGQVRLFKHDFVVISESWLRKPAANCPLNYLNESMSYEILTQDKDKFD